MKFTYLIFSSNDEKHHLIKLAGLKERVITSEIRFSDK